MSILTATRSGRFYTLATSARTTGTKTHSDSRQARTKRSKAMACSSEFSGLRRYSANDASRKPQFEIQAAEPPRRTTTVPAARSPKRLRLSEVQTKIAAIR